MEQTLHPLIALYMAITFNFSTGEIGWSSSTAGSGAPADPGDTLLLQAGDDVLLQSGDFLLLQ